MKKFIALLTSLVWLAMPTALAHQPVQLLTSDITAEKGPVLVDGTISFAVRVSFAKAGETRGFRIQHKQGDSLSLQYLIVDKAPENKLKSSQLPIVKITSPTGKVISIKITERSKFFEPYSRTNYFYLARFGAVAETGIYKVLVTSKSKSSITLAVGDREVSGEVRRGAIEAQVNTLPTPTPTPTPTPISTVEAVKGFTLAQVAVNNSAEKCWSVIDNNVYDLTKWIKSHPGGQAAITFICGIDGTNAFLAQHRGQSSPFSRLASFYLAPFIK